MRIGVPKETAEHERRVALVPATVARLVKAGHEVVIERGAGVAAFYADAEYLAAGAALGGEEAAGDADVVCRVRRPNRLELGRLREGAVLASMLQPAASAPVLDALAARGVTALAMELVPRTTKAQAMDVLSSQATVAGYQAVLLGASRLGRLMPMLTTAAGTLTPSKAFIIGAGVAGLQAIATARRLGAIVSAFDVRPVVREQVMSLGASFVEAEAVSTAAEGSGGYAKELADEQQRKVLDAVGKHIVDMDLVITTAQIPGKPAPRLITGEMVAGMRPGSVIMDLAGETGGNCELTKFGEEVTSGGVTIIGPANLPAMLPWHASLMYSRNVQSLLDHLIKDGKVEFSVDDPITGPMCVTHGGQVRYGRPS